MNNLRSTAKSIGRIAFTAFLSLAALSSCLKDADPDVKTTAATSFEVVLPASDVVETRGVGTEAENAVTDIYILAFQQTAGGNLLYKEKVTAFTFSGTNKDKITFKASIPTGSYDVILIANAAAVVESLGGTVSQGGTTMTKTSLANAVILSSMLETSKKASWKLGSGGKVEPIVMVSGYSALSIPSGSAISFYLNRVSARIDVINSATLTFEMTGICYCNYSDEAYLVPRESGTGQTSIPTTPAAPKNGVADGLRFGSSDIVSNRLEQKLYPLGARGGYRPVSEDWKKKNPCLVIGGKYGATAAARAAAPETYYRIDLIDNSGNYLSILGNYHYIVNIGQVNGAGYADEDTAYERAPMNHLSLTEVIAPGSGYVTVDGYYWLTISERELVFEGAGGDKSLILQTNYPDWSWDGQMYSDAGCTTTMTGWLTSITPGSGTVTSDTNVKFTASANSGESRTGYVRVTAGRMSAVVKVTQQGSTIEVSPATLILPWHGVNTLSHNVEVTCSDSNGNPDPSMEWTLTVPSQDSWFSITLNADGSGAGNTVSGVGSMTVYTIATANPSTTAERATTIYLNGNPVDVRVNVRQLKKVEEQKIVVQNLDSCYVGAFWRVNQTGERLIRIPVGTSEDKLGQWSAWVAWTDGNWAEGDIVLDTYDSPDPGITWNIATENPHDAELYQLTSTDTYVCGEVRTGDMIKFRIGLKSRYTPTTNRPVRYAVVVVSFGAEPYGRHQKIYLRQGEDPDYIMEPNDPVDQYYVASTRTHAAKFSPFNLTASNMGEGGANAANHPRVGVHNGVFVEFPSQAGAFFAWADETGVIDRRALHPVNPNGTTSIADLPDIVGPGESNYWKDIEMAHETCPWGYVLSTGQSANFRRPTDGPIDGPSAGLASESMMRQSLRLYPYSEGQTGEIDPERYSSFYGFYADGFFDRRGRNSEEIPVLTSISNINRAVSWKTVGNNLSKNIAYNGRVLINPRIESGHYNASIFFPAAGLRNYGRMNSGALNNAGSASHYLSASSLLINDGSYGDRGWYVMISATGNPILYVSSSKGMCAPVRCVVDTRIFPPQ